MNAKYIILLFSLFLTAVAPLPWSRRLLELSREKREVSEKCHLIIDGTYYYYYKGKIEKFDSESSSLAWYCRKGDATKDANGKIRGLPMIIAAKQYDEKYRPLTISNGKLVLSEIYYTMEDLKKCSANRKCDIEMSVVKNEKSGHNVLKTCSGSWQLPGNSLSKSYNTEVVSN